MTLSLFIAIQMLVMIGAVVQTITGGAFVVLVLIGVILLDAFPLEHAVLLVMLLSLAQIFMVLERATFQGANVQRIRFLWILLPTTICGVFILYGFIGYPLGYQILYVILALGTLLASVTLFVSGKPRATQSPPYVFYVLTGIAGLTGGIFSVSSPPMVYLLYNQPWALHAIRQTLLTTFAIVIIIRGVVVYAQGNFVLYVVWWTLLSIPTLVITTKLTKRYMHYLNDTIIRKVTFALLFIGGINMLIRAYGDIVALLT